MNASDTSPDKGNECSDESVDKYPQYCLNCLSEFDLVGEPGEEKRRCPVCGEERATVMFFRWWAYKHEDSEPVVEIELSEEFWAAVDELARVGCLDRDEILEDLVSPKWEFVESGETE